MKPPSSDLRRLVDAWHDGTISAEDALRLERHLLHDEEAREYFFDVSEIEAALPQAAGRLPVVGSQPVVKKSGGGWWRIAAVFLVGAVSGALVLKATAPRALKTSASHPAALVTGMLGVSWEGESSTRAVALQANAAESKIASGLLEITFGSGTRALVEGPAAFQVLGDNSMRLSYGKVVADVPKGAEGFSVDYADGKIVDLGTEFGVEVLRGGRAANFGVFRGEIEFQPQTDIHKPVRLLENHAIEAEGDKIVSVPFDREKFTRRIPSRELSWEIKASPPRDVTWNFDISHLIWTPGRYRAICKWMKGRHGIAIDRMELLLDGEPIAVDVHPGFTGRIENTRDNTYELDLPPALYRRGSWSLRVTARVDNLAEEPSDSAGVILVEDGITVNAEPSDFIGVWEYLHDGKLFRRTFLADGTATLDINGKPYPGYEGSRWTVENGVLLLDIVIAGRAPIRERHVLRDARTLVFINLPYRDAVKSGP